MWCGEFSEPWPELRLNQISDKDVLFARQYLAVHALLDSKRPAPMALSHMNLWVLRPNIFLGRQACQRYVGFQAAANAFSCRGEKGGLARGMHGKIGEGVSW